MSDYYYSLKDSVCRKRYKQKLSLFEDQDPYLMASRNLLNQSDAFPEFRYALGVVGIPV